MTQDSPTQAEQLSKTDQLKASPRMFKSDLLDSLSRVHPAFVLAVFVPTVGILLALSIWKVSVLTTVLLFVLGWFIWGLFEYWMHRVVFHFEPERGIGAKFHWIIHGVHHDHPNDPLRLVMPPAASIPLAVAVCLVLATVFGTPNWYPIGAGFLTGYLGYDMTHFYVHHFKPRGRVGKLFRELHMRHHFQDSTKSYGVSAPWWDHVFGTAPKRRGKLS